MRRSLLSTLSLPWAVLGQTHLLCPPATADGSNLVVDASFEEANVWQYWTLKEGMYTGTGTFEPADGSSYFIIPVGGIEGYSGYFQQNVTVELDIRYYGSLKVRPRVQNPESALSRTPTPRTCTVTAALQGTVGGTFQDTATFYVKPDAVFDWETLGFDFKNSFSGSVRFFITTSCDGPMASLEMDFDSALVQRVDAPDACSNVNRPDPITGTVAATASPSQSTSFATSTVSAASSTTTTTTTVTPDPAVSTVEVTITAPPVTTTTYTTVLISATTTSTVTVYASTATTTVTATDVVATTTVTVTADATQPARLRRRRGCRQPTASNTAPASSTTSSSAETYASATATASASASPSESASASASASDSPSASASDSASTSGTATAASDSTSLMTMTSAPATSSSSSTASLFITSTTTTTTTVTPTVTVDGGMTLVEVPPPVTTVTLPVTTMTATATDSVTSTSTLTISTA